MFFYCKAKGKDNEKFVKSVIKSVISREERSFRLLFAFRRVIIDNES